MIYLREISEKDLERINNYRDKKELNDNFTSPFRYVNIETDKEWFLYYMKNRESNIRLAICLKDNNEMIGMISLLNIDPIIRSGDCGGFVIYENTNKGKGYGYQALFKLLEHAFYDRNLERVQSHWLKDNKLSIHIGKKCGFKEEGILRKGTYKNGKYHDLILMSVLREEFDEIFKKYYSIQ